MARISQHFVPEGNVACQHCGTITAEIAVKSCIWRDVPDGETREGMRPEPSLRTNAADDADVISKRLAELASERAAAFNASDTVATTGTVAPDPLIG